MDISYVNLQKPSSETLSLACCSFIGNGGSDKWYFNWKFIYFQKIGFSVYFHSLVSENVKNFNFFH